MRAKSNENAVSPVVGVMLMLVVTIIIAAVVSGFAGGLTGSQTTTPVVSLQAEYSIQDGMSIWHNGGDTLTIGEFRILLTPSANFDSIESDAYVSEISQLLIEDGSGTFWYDYKGGREVPRFAAGDVAYINTTNCYTEKLTPSLTYVSYGKTYNKGINQTEKVGATFYLDFVAKDGKRITRMEVPVKP
ncbi:MAG: type IV pilin N-terminal domain-containing protein [Methanomicrobiaceae archaeon]|nr:type IV pilin N-terminal domain-containing protein [Methanomicrobiaceae archaeon]